MTKKIKPQAPKKWIIEDRVQDIDGYSLELPLGELLTKVQGLIEKYGPDAQVNYESYNADYYGDREYHQHYITIKREETDDEFRDRLAKEKSKQEAIEKRDREELARLQAKFGENK